VYNVGILRYQTLTLLTLIIFIYFYNMPLIFQQQIDIFTKIGVWHITETDNFFLAKVSLHYPINHPHKRLQHLAGRFLLQELFPDFPLTNIEIADNRKPFLQSQAYHFSISHCGNYAAAIVSQKSRVGVDIEIPQPKILGIQHKFFTQEELVVFENNILTPIAKATLVWSIKEAIFKWYSAGKVDFKAHIQVKAINVFEDTINATCFFLKHQKMELQVKNIWIEGVCICWVVN
jgi:4'-phosphopantetheinyl transferase EntD